MSSVDSPADPDDQNAEVPNLQESQSLKRAGDTEAPPRPWKPVHIGLTLPPIAFPKLADDLRKTGDLLGSLAGVREQLMFNVLKPYSDFQAAWQKDLSASINRTGLEIVHQSQSNILGDVANLALGFDFTGISRSLNLGGRIGAAFVEQQASIFKNLAPALEALRVSFYPPNLSEIDDLWLQTLSEVVLEDGIPLYGVPRRSTAEALIRAASTPERRQILGRRWKTIVADCRQLIEGCDSDAVAPFLPFANAAAVAIESGHPEAAQALTGSLIDALVAARLGKDRYTYTPNAKTLTSDAYFELTVREFLAFAPIWMAYQQFRAANGDKVPGTYNRNATAHTVSKRQFNRRNAVQGLMLACSLLSRLDEEATFGGRAD